MGDTAHKVFERRLRSRRRKETRFKFYGVMAIVLAISVLVMILGSIFLKGVSAFYREEIELTFQFTERAEGQDDTSYFKALVDAALDQEIVVSDEVQKHKRHQLVSIGTYRMLKEIVQSEKDITGQTRKLWVPAASEVDQLRKGEIKREVPESDRKITDRQIKWVDILKERGKLDRKFKLSFLTHGDSREPELAGIYGALKGSLFTLLVTFLLSFPIGVITAIYLEEFAKKNRWTDLIEVNINNLAAVPSIIFGLLSLAIFLNFFHLPRSASLVGGLTLMLMILPMIIIASRTALRSVPRSIRDAARGIGASEVQVVFHHALPLAMPGILTGTIIGMARALGESAPLLMIGMVAFIVDPPGDISDPSTVLPVQIYQWALRPERGFVENTSGAIMILLLFLFIMNVGAIYLRRKFEKRW